MKNEIDKKTNNTKKDVSKTIKRLEIVNTILIVAMVIVGIITVIDIVVPDPILFLDEAALASITALLKLISSNIEKKINDLKEHGQAYVYTEEVTDTIKAVSSTAKDIKRSRNKKGEIE